MFKLVVLSALVAVAMAKPGLYHGAVEIATPIIAKTYVAPVAVSSTYREDIVKKPAAVTYAAAPVYTYAAKAVVSEPVAVAAPIVAKTVVKPAAVSHTYREDTISKPVAVTYTAPASFTAPVVQEAVVSAPVAYAVPAAVSSSYRTDAVSSPVVSKTIITPTTYTYAAYAPAAYAYAGHAW